jgi:hypothetical protein
MGSFACSSSSSASMWRPSARAASTARAASSARAGPLVRRFCWRGRHRRRERPRRCEFRPCGLLHRLRCSRCELLPPTRLREGRNKWRPGAKLLFRAAGFAAGGGGLLVRSSASWPAAVDCLFLFRGCGVVGRCSFIVQVSSCCVDEATTLVAYPMSSAARQHGRWTSSDSGGQMRRLGAPAMTCTLEDWSCFSVIFLCSGVLCAKVRGCFCNATVLFP